MTRPFHLRPQQHAPKLVMEHAPKLGMAVAAASLCTLLEAPAAVAQPIVVGSGEDVSYRYEFATNAGDVAPAGTGSWLIAVISPLATGNGVQIKLNANLSDPEEFISRVGFTLDRDYGNISWSCSSSDVGVVGSSNCGSSLLLPPPELNFANGIKGLDIGFDLPTANGNGSDRFQGDDEMVFELLASGLNPASFANAISSSGPLSLIHAAARVQGIKGSPGSTTIVAEAPGPLPLLGVGVALAYCRRLRQRLNRAEGLG